MKKAALFLITASLFLSNLSSQPHDALLLVNMDDAKETPGQFRTCKDAFKKKEKKMPSREGLDDLNASGSAQFSQKALKEIHKSVGEPENFFIVDLRQESHGFVNGMAVAWFYEKNWGNIGKNNSDIKTDELMNLSELNRKKFALMHWVLKKEDDGTIGDTICKPVVVRATSNEEKFVTSQGLDYVRFFVSDHRRPEPETVNAFVAFVRETSKKNPWLHFHCKAGKGRTTLFLIMYDMMKNAKLVSLEDIIARQRLIGGNDVNKRDEKNQWRQTCYIERSAFVERFYEYCKQNKDDFKESWTQYCSRTKTEK